MNIQQLILQNTKDRYTMELKYVDDENIKEQIMKIVEKLEKPSNNKIDTFNNKMNEMEKLTMKKQFYRLKKLQKVNLIKDYYKSKNVDDDKLENFAENIMELLENSTLKNKDIEYDMENTKIKNINKMTIENNELKYIKTVKTVKRKTKSVSDSDSD
jgi:hypothetical protein